MLRLFVSAAEQVFCCLAAVAVCLVCRRRTGRACFAPPRFFSLLCVLLVLRVCYVSCVRVLHDASGVPSLSFVQLKTGPGASFFLS